jgi:ribonucleoside-diphosphate reductase alpha chain
MTRISETLSDDLEHYKKLKDILLNMRFLPAGRVQAAIGSPRKITPYNCLDGDTEIITLDGVKKLLQCNREETILDGNGEWVTVPIINHGKQKIIYVRLSNGKKSVHLNVTPDHLWIIEGENNRIPTTAIRVGDKIPNLKRTKIENRDAVVHGLIYGDGTKTKDNGYVIHVCDYHEETYPYLEGLPFSETKLGRIYYIFGNNIKTKYKELPENPSPDYVVGFLRGLFLADGCLTQQPEYIITGTLELYNWAKKYGPVGGFYVIGKSKLSEQTNFGIRNRDTFNIRFDIQNIIKEDCLKNNFSYDIFKGWRIAEIRDNCVEANVYCPSVYTTQSFLLANGAVFGNCFVSQPIEDSMAGIMDSATKAAYTMRMGGGIGYDFSTLRPRGDRIVTLGSRSSGPISFMGIFDAVCSTVSSAGHRRGAQMGVLRVDHPDIREFIRAKQNTNNLTNFNISIGITDNFMRAVESDSSYDLIFNGRTYDRLSASALWDEIMRSTWDWAEPGVLFIDRINELNNLWYCENIAATNPCAEQPLPPNGACLLGSFNLVKYIKQEGKKFVFDYEALRQDIPVVVRAMDNVVDSAIYPLPEQEYEAKSKRRMGLGITGLANAGEVQGWLYGSIGFRKFERTILSVLANEAYKASAAIAKEKGPFPLFDKEKYLAGRHISSLEETTRAAIAECGIRNSHLTSIAPTGTISLTADNVSSGIEPVFTFEYERTLKTFEGFRKEIITDYAFRTWGIKGKPSSEVTAEEHLGVLIDAYKYVDSAVSKTCNVSPEMPWDDFKNIYAMAWKGGCKGCTTFNPGGKRYGVLNALPASEENQGLACYIDPDTGNKTCE